MGKRVAEKGSLVFGGTDFVAGRLDLRVGQFVLDCFFKDGMVRT
jgi:hypothetical protein